MATVATFIDGARYDLRDYLEGLEFDDTELIEYINRVVPILDSVLASLNSDLVRGTADVTLSSAASTIAISSINSGNIQNIRSVWISTDKKEQLSADQMDYERQFIGTNTGEPDFWAIVGAYIQFERAADANYTVRFFYNSKTATLTSSSNMPYSDLFNNTIREMLIVYARAKKEGNIGKTDLYTDALFKKHAMEITIRRNFVPKPYKLDF